MSARSSTETLAQIFLTLVKERTISQADLARAVDVDVKALRRHLLNMQAAGMPLERSEEHPHVYWSVPKSWVPGGVVIPAADVVDVVRHLLRARASASRDRVLERLLHRSGSNPRLPDVDRFVSAELDAEQDAHLAVFEEALATKAVVTMRFFSATRGAIEDRAISVHRVVPTDPAKVLAVCHRDDVIKWFRLDNVQRVALDKQSAYRERTDEAIEQVLLETRFGFHQRGHSVACSFVVRAPEHRWVAQQLGSDVSRTPVGDDVRFEITTAAVRALARFVVSLGEAARVETPQLADEVERLARGALNGAQPLAS